MNTSKTNYKDTSINDDYYITKTNQNYDYLYIKNKVDLIIILHYGIYILLFSIYIKVVFSLIKFASKKMSYIYKFNHGVVLTPSCSNKCFYTFSYTLELQFLQLSSQYHPL